MDPLLWTFLLAGFAGLVSYLQRFAGAPTERPPWEWSVAFIKVITGSFVGLLTLWLIGKRIEDQGHVNVAIALAGYGGPVTLDFALQVGKDLLAAWVLRAAQSTKDDAPKG